jgi:adenylylsulfate kinase
MNGQVIWITGLSGAGKTTLAEGLNIDLKKSDLRPILLDGDKLRNIFGKGNLGSDSYDRNARIDLALRYGLLCQTLSSQGFTVIISTIAMFEEIFAWNRENIKNYFEVYLKVPLDELFVRDPKKIYKDYKDGRLSNVAGLDLLVDEPISPDVTFDFDHQPTLWKSPEILKDTLLLELERKSFLINV